MNTFVYDVFYIWQMDGGEVETFMTRLGRLWQSGPLIRNGITGQAVAVCDGVTLEWFNENVWLTVGKPFEEKYIRMEASDENMMDYYLGGVPYEKGKIAGEFADFVEDYLC